MAQNNHNNHNHEEEEMEMQDLVSENSLLVDALVKILIKKKIMTEEEFEQAIQELEDENDDDEIDHTE